MENERLKIALSEN